MNTAQGFTLVEIMVVLAISAIIGGVAYANFGSFREDQALNNAVLDLGNIIHLAQTNSISAVKCLNVGDASWSLEFKTNRTDIDLRCSTTTNATPGVTTTSVIKTLKLNGVTVNSIVGTGVGGCNSSFLASGISNSIIVGFAPLYGTASFQDISAICLSASQKLEVTLKDTKTGTFKVVTLNKGGGLD